MIQVQDHLGNTYRSVTEMCIAYGISRCTFSFRFDKKGWTLEDSLTKPLIKQKAPVKDHMGNQYPSISAMCRAYNISRDSFMSRKNKGLSIEECLLGRN